MNTLRQIALIGLVWLSATLTAVAMTTSEVRAHARFMTDRMGHELQLSVMQRDDVYEINYDFFAGMQYLMDDLVRGDAEAVDRYYECLDMRNEDLSYVLTRNQYERFVGREYFYRPLRTTGSRWEIRLYSVYTNHAHFYFSVPSIYLTYNGLHSRIHFSTGFYRHRYHHPRYVGPMVRPSHHTHYADFRRHDFGIRPGTRPVRPPHRPAVPAPRPSQPAHRPQRPHRPGSEVSPRPIRPGHSVRPTHPQTRPESKPVRPSTRPNRPSTRPQTKPDQRPDRRANARPSAPVGTRPVVRPEHRPERRSSDRPAHRGRNKEEGRTEGRSIRL